MEPDSETWAWDVRTKHVAYETIPTVDGVRAIAIYGPTGTLFTFGPDYTIQQYDVERAQLVASVRHVPMTVPPTPPEDNKALNWMTTAAENEEEVTSPLGRVRQELHAAEASRLDRNQVASPQSQPNGATSTAHKSAVRKRHQDMMASPANKSDYTTTSFETGPQSQGLRESGYGAAAHPQTYQTHSPGSARSTRKASRLRQEVIMSPEERPVIDLFPFIRARLSDVPFRAPKSTDEDHMSPDDLRRQMLSVVFGWDEDIRDLIRCELSQHPQDSQNAIFLSKWLDDDPDHLAEIMGSTSLISNIDWMLLALGSLSSQAGSAKKITQIFIEKMLTKGDIHAAATLMLAVGDQTDAIEVYVSRSHFMEAVLLTCLLTPTDWQRQSFLVRKWGEHVVENSQQALAIRCFSCTGVEPSDPWTSPAAQLATRGPDHLTPVQPASSIVPPVQLVQPVQPVQLPLIYQKTLERRRTLDAPTPIAMPAPPTPFRTAMAQGTRITPQTSALKLITSFSTQTNQYKFPGLRPSDRTPTNVAAVTPIAESAIDRSALSPGGLGSYRLNNARSINNVLSTRAAASGSLHTRRLPSIGETPIDVDAPPLPVPVKKSRSFLTPADSGSDKEKEKAVADDQSAPSSNVPAGNDQPSLLLTSARYEPANTSARETPQTALGPQTTIRYPELYNSLAQPVDNGEMDVMEALRPRTGSKSRRPDGLSIQMVPVQEIDAPEEYLPSVSYDEVPSRPATTESYSATQLDTTGEYTSPPTTGNSYRGLKSPAVTGRSLDQYISSLEQAYYYDKHARARTHSSASKQSREEQPPAERKKNRHHHRHHHGGETDEMRGRDERRPVPSAKRSPSSPVPMSPEDIRMYSASAESFDSLYSSNASASALDRTSTPASQSNLSRRGSQSTTKGTRRRRRSRSKPSSAKGRDGSRVVSRHASPEPSSALHRDRGRSTSRKDGGHGGPRSPSSPRPMVPSEDDRQGRSETDAALRLVSQDRQRLHRSTSRRPERGTSARRDPSPDRRRHRTRSRSRQAEDREQGLRRRSSHSERSRRRRHRDRSYDGENVDDEGASESRRGNDAHGHSLAPASFDHEMRPASLPHPGLERSKKELAAAELEARRLSLARRPSVPNIPFPGQGTLHNKSASTGHMPPPLQRAYTDNGSVVKDSQDQSNGLTPAPAGRRERPGTPRAMQVVLPSPEPDVPVPTDLAEVLKSDVYRPPTAEGISRPSSTRPPHAGQEVIAQMPKHPAYDNRIAGSRSSSKSRDGRSRGTSRDRTKIEGPTTFGLNEAAAAAGPVANWTPPILPELQHLASPLPPPPPPPPGAANGSPLSSQYQSPQLPSLPFVPDATSVPLPLSAAKALFSPTEPPLFSGGPAATGGQHRRSRSGNGNGESASQFIGKIRNFTNRVRSTSRGRDNEARSPPMRAEVMPYESIPGSLLPQTQSQPQRPPLSSVVEF